jgi:class 3 adenylate cyclase
MSIPRRRLARVGKPGHARPHDVLVSADIVELAPGAAEFAPIGDLRGLAGPVALYRALFRDSLPAG